MVIVNKDLKNRLKRGVCVDKQGSLSRWVLGRASVARGAASEANVGEISKKELLKLTGLSYGQLYRWKRMQLIPEQWFIHRATFTGQETFFPRTQILKRIETIQRLKDRYSLEEIAELLSPASAARRYTREDIEDLTSCSAEGLALVDTVHQSSDSGYAFVDLVACSVADELAKRDIDGEAAVGAVATLIAGAGQFSSLDDLHVVCANLGEFDDSNPFAVLYAGREPVVFGDGVNVRADVEVGPIAEALREELERLLD